MLNKKFFQKDIYIISIWLLLPIINWIIDFPNNRYNNYKIFSSMFWHMVDGKNLYLAYPSDHGDFFYYGPALVLSSLHFRYYQTSWAGYCGDYLTHQF